MVSKCATHVVQYCMSLSYGVILRYTYYIMLVLQLLSTLLCPLSKRHESMPGLAMHNHPNSILLPCPPSHIHSLTWKHKSTAKFFAKLSVHFKLMCMCLCVLFSRNNPPYPIDRSMSFRHDSVLRRIRRRFDCDMETYIKTIWQSNRHQFA